MELDVAQLSPHDTYKLLIGTVLPRPIAFVATHSVGGVPNLAPFSFFNVVSGHPPIVAIAVGRRLDGRRKDTAENAAQTGELVVNVVDEDLAERMNLTSGEWPPETDEFTLAGLTPLPSVRVRPSRVAESPIHLECHLERLITLGAGKHAHDVLFAEIIYYHVRDDLYQEGRIDTDRLRPVGRLAGDGYTRTRDTFAMRRPVAEAASPSVTAGTRPPDKRPQAGGDDR